MAIEIPNALVAYGKVNADGTKASGAGFKSAQAGGTGNPYQITLDEAAPAGETNFICSIKAAALSKSEIVATDTSDTVKTVTTGDNGVAADHAFSFVCYRQPKQ